MSKRTKNNISKRLNQAQTAINNTLADPEIQGLMAGYGYSAAKMTEGKQLYQQAVAVVEAQSAAAGSQQFSTKQTLNAGKTALEAYQGLAKVARAVYVRDRAQRVALGLSGLMPKNTPAFLTAAYTLFDNVIGNPSIKATLSIYGYDDGRLQSERAKILAYDSMNQAQDAAKGAAQQATQEQDALMKSLSDWLAQFIKIAKVALHGKPQLLEKLSVVARSSKTPAQRAAPKKAAATRKAKKGVKEVPQKVA
jgi:hypothetical protein